ncbi:DUF6114 domain-containing protein [Actinoplanes sp. HUAS TT8]|uniref:DUF6114 domain-containing protein n=1 Tax=Actinoplanes sp. HUAS TT8 TaxID=3447453 RepID=UPI003F51E7C4
MATDDFWNKFRRWRRARPFWGGLFLVLSGVELLWSSNMDLANIQIHIGQQGFLSYVLPVLMLLCGTLVWFTPAQRMFYGIIGLLAALYSFIGLNLGGWFFGMILGIVGGALTVAWTEQAPRPGNKLQGTPEHSGPPQFAGPHDGPGEATQRIEVAGHDDRPHEAPVVSDPSILPGFGGPRGAAPGDGATPGETDGPRDDLPGPRRGLNRKALAIILVPALAGATMLVGSRLPASADDCPAGLSAVTTPASAKATSAAPDESAAAKATISAKPDGKATTTTPAATDKAGETSAGPSASASAAAAADDGGGILGGIQDVVDGLGNLLGIGDDDESATPSASPSASATSAPAAEPSTTTTTTAPAGDDETSKPASAAPSKTAASVAPSSSADVIPCLGARQEGMVADEGGIPRSALKPGTMKVASLTMIDSSYGGVAEVPTANGTIKALKFDMYQAINKPFSLTIDEAGGATTTIKSNELTTTGNVHFYTPKFTGNLFGVFPVVFTPEQPPPLVPAFLWFTNVTIDLAFVSCDKLTADPLQITES